MSITARKILSSAPQRFRVEKAQGHHFIFHFIISGDEDFALSLIIKDGACTLLDELQGVADCVIEAAADTYIALETGSLNPQAAFMSGAIRVSNISAMISFSKCFRKFTPEIIENDTNSGAHEIIHHTSTIRNKRKGPLEGVSIIDFTRLLPGPMATMLLADMGADVIKVEDPDSPDYVRFFEPMIGRNSAYYYALNRNKRSLAVNFLSTQGKEILTALIKKADVLIEQYRPGVMAKFGLSYEVLKTINPRLIYISITGYGQESALSQAAGHDLNYIAIAGALGITGYENGEPVIPGFQLADIAGGSYMAMTAVTAALYKREKTGHGEWLDIAMTDSVLPFIALPYAEAQLADKHSGRGKFQLSGGQANYNIYKCSDGKYVAMGSLEPKFWNKVCERLGKKEWQEKITGDEQTQMQVRDELRKIFLTKTRDEWCTLFAEDDACITPVNEIDEIGNDAYLNERKLFIDFEVAGKKIKTIAQPVKYASAAGAAHWPAPLLGEDTRAILSGLGHTDENIHRLIKENIIKTQ
jgi:alpha-methylacyl-CoA racemase